MLLSPILIKFIKQGLLLEKEAYALTKAACNALEDEFVQQLIEEKEITIEKVKRITPCASNCLRRDTNKRLLKDNLLNVNEVLDFYPAMANAIESFANTKINITRAEILHILKKNSIFLSKFATKKRTFNNQTDTPEDYKQTLKLKKCKRISDFSTPPQVIHFIWMGSEVPDKYRPNLITFSELARAGGFTVNLYVDDIAEEAEKKRVKFENLPFSSSINLININTLLLKAKTDSFLKKHMNILEPYIQQLRIGIKNFGAVSDILRYLILYINGGHYCDLDVYFLQPPHRKIQKLDDQDSKPFSIQMAFSVQWNEKVGFASDCISSTAKHFLTKEIIAKIIQNLANCENFAEDTKNLHNSDKNTFPRTSILNKSNLIGRSSRLFWGVKNTGPHVVQTVLKKYEDADSLSFPYAESNEPLATVMCNQIFMNYPKYKPYLFLSLYCSSLCDAEWLKGADDRSSFDDNHIPKKYHGMKK